MPPWHPYAKVVPAQNRLMCISLYAGHFDIWLFWAFHDTSRIQLGVFIWFCPRNFKPRNFQFSVGFSLVGFIYCTSLSWDLDQKMFFYASFNLFEKFTRWCSPTQTPTQKSKIEFSMFSTQEIGPSLVSFQMIFEAPQSEQLRFKFYSLWSKILKILNSTYSKWLCWAVRGFLHPTVKIQTN